MYYQRHGLNLTFPYESNGCKSSNTEAHTQQKHWTQRTQFTSTSSHVRPKQRLGVVASSLAKFLVGTPPGMGRKPKDTGSHATRIGKVLLHLVQLIVYAFMQGNAYACRDARHSARKCNIEERAQWNVCTDKCTRILKWVQYPFPYLVWLLPS